MSRDALNPQLVRAILHDRAHIAAAGDATTIPLEQAAGGYAEFDAGAAITYVLDANVSLGSA